MSKKTAAPIKLSSLKAAPKAANPGGLLAANGGVTATAAPAYAPAIDPQFGADVNAAQLNLSTTLQQNEAQRGQLGSSYGFGVDASGNVMDDHTNPFSKAAALQTSYDNSQRGTLNSYAARGQLYSGAIQNAQDWNQHQNLQGRDTLMREFMGARSQLDMSDTGAKNAYSSAVSQAQAQAAQYALEQARAQDQSAAYAQMAAQHAAAQSQGAQQQVAAAVAKKKQPVMSSKKLVGRR